MMHPLLRLFYSRFLPSVLLLILLAIGFQTIFSSRSLSFLVAQGEPHSNSQWFMGLRQASPEEIRKVLPQAMGKPCVLDFSSRFCHDCQRMSVILADLEPRYPGIYFRRVDVVEDASKYPALMRTFKPVSVPVLIFIDSQTHIQNVLYNYQKPAIVIAALNRLQKAQ